MSAKWLFASVTHWFFFRIARATTKIKNTKHGDWRHVKA